MKTREEVEHLKDNWRRDPCYDIECVTGFDEYRAELIDFRDQMNLIWFEQRLAKQAKETRRLQDKATKLECSVELVRYIESIEYRLSELQGS